MNEISWEGVTYAAGVGPVGNGGAGEDAVLLQRRRLLLVGGGAAALYVAVVAGDDIPMRRGVQVRGLLLADGLLKVGLANVQFLGSTGSCRGGRTHESLG